MNCLVMIGVLSLLTADQVPEVVVKDSNSRKHNSPDVNVRFSTTPATDNKSEVTYLSRDASLSATDTSGCS